MYLSQGCTSKQLLGFIDATVRPVSRPGTHQRDTNTMDTKTVNSIKFQSVVAPNGLIANLYGPVEGKRHDSGMLADSNLLNSLRQHTIESNGNSLCIYGDPAYPLHVGCTDYRLTARLE